MAGSTEAYLAVDGPRKEITLGWAPAGVGEIHRVTLSHDAGLAIYATEVAEEPLTDDEWDDYDEDNWGDLPSTVWVAATQTGVKKVTMTFSAQSNMGDEYNEDWGGGESEASVTFTVSNCGLKSVTFAAAEGGGYHPVYVDTTGVVYGTPQWQDNSDAANGHLDGDAEDWDDDPADHEYPVCYESGTNLKVTVLFLADPEEDFADATIAGDGPEGLDFDAEEADFVTISGKDYARVEFESAAAFTSTKVDWFPSLEVKWTLKSGSRILVERSANEVFVTLGEPACDKLYRTVAYLACSNTGAEDEDVALAHTWDLFSTGTGPADVCGWNDGTGWYDRPLHYYLERGPGGGLADLLSDGDGQCSAWAELLWESLLVNGVDDGVPVVVHPSTCDYFAVKEIDFGDPTYPNDPPFIYLHDVETDSGDLDTSVSDIPGQNTNPPAEKLFAWHVICLYLGPDGTYFDPSYGITYTSEADFLSKAVDAWGDTFAGGEIRWCPVSALPNEEIVFDTPLRSDQCQDTCCSLLSSCFLLFLWVC